MGTFLGCFAKAPRKEHISLAVDSQGNCIPAKKMHAMYII